MAVTRFAFFSPTAYLKTSGQTSSQGDPASSFPQVENGRGIIVNGILASGAGTKLGDQVNLLTLTGEQTYTVAGIASDYLNAKTTTAYISQANIAADFGRTEDIFYQINLKSGADETAVDAAFQEIVKPYPQFKLAAGLFFGALAAVIPARQAARMDVVTALRYE